MTLNGLTGSIAAEYFMPQKNSPTRVAIIGTGGMANAHVQRFKETRGCRLVAAVDVDSEKLTAFAAKHGIP